MPSSYHSQTPLGSRNNTLIANKSSAHEPIQISEGWKNRKLNNNSSNNTKFCGNWIQNCCCPGVQGPNEVKPNIKSSLTRKIPKGFNSKAKAQKPNEPSKKEVDIWQADSSSNAMRLVSRLTEDQLSENDISGAPAFPIYGQSGPSIKYQSISQPTNRYNLKNSGYQNWNYSNSFVNSNNSHPNFQIEYYPNTVNLNSGQNYNNVGKVSEPAWGNYNNTSYQKNNTMPNTKMQQNSDSYSVGVDYRNYYQPNFINCNNKSQNQLGHKLYIDYENMKSQFDNNYESYPTPESYVNGNLINNNASPTDEGSKFCEFIFKSKSDPLGEFINNNNLINPQTSKKSKTFPQPSNSNFNQSQAHPEINQQDQMPHIPVKFRQIRSSQPLSSHKTNMAQHKDYDQPPKFGTENDKSFSFYAYQPGPNDSAGLHFFKNAHDSLNGEGKVNQLPYTNQNNSYDIWQKPSFNFKNNFNQSFEDTTNKNDYGQAAFNYFENSSNSPKIETVQGPNQTRVANMPYQIQQNNLHQKSQVGLGTNQQNYHSYQPKYDCCYDFFNNYCCGNTSMYNSRSFSETKNGGNFHQNYHNSFEKGSIAPPGYVPIQKTIYVPAEQAYAYYADDNDLSKYVTGNVPEKRDNDYVPYYEKFYSWWPFHKRLVAEQDQTQDSRQQSSQINESDIRQNADLAVSRDRSEAKLSTVSSDHTRPAIPVKFRVIRRPQYKPKPSKTIDIFLPEDMSMSSGQSSMSPPKSSSSFEPPPPKPTSANIRFHTYHAPMVKGAHFPACLNLKKKPLEPQNFFLQKKIFESENQSNQKQSIEPEPMASHEHAQTQFVAQNATIDQNPNYQYDQKSTDNLFQDYTQYRNSFEDVMNAPIYQSKYDEQSENLQNGRQINAGPSYEFYDGMFQGHENKPYYQNISPNEHYLASNYTAGYPSYTQPHNPFASQVQSTPDSNEMRNYDMNYKHEENQNYHQAYRQQPPYVPPGFIPIQKTIYVPAEQAYAYYADDNDLSKYVSGNVPEKKNDYYSSYCDNLCSWWPFHKRLVVEQDQTQDSRQQSSQINESDVRQNTDYVSRDRSETKLSTVSSDHTRPAIPVKFRVIRRPQYKPKPSKTIDIFLPEDMSMSSGQSSMSPPQSSSSSEPPPPKPTSANIRFHAYHAPKQKKICSSKPRAAENLYIQAKANNDEKGNSDDAKQATVTKPMIESNVDELKQALDNSTNTIHKRTEEVETNVIEKINNKNLTPIFEQKEMIYPQKMSLSSTVSPSLGAADHKKSDVLSSPVMRSHNANVNSEGNDFIASTL